MRYVVDAKEPFIVPLTHQGGDRVEAVSEPFKTITGANRGEKALIMPTLVHYHADKRPGDVRASDLREPLKTQTTENRHGLVTAFLTEHANASTQRTFPIDEPMRTQVAQVKGGHFSMVAASLVKHYTGVVGSDLADPIGTVTSVDHHSLMTATMVGAGGPAYSGKPTPVDQPVGTLTTENHRAIATAHLVHMGHGEGKDGTKRFSHGIRDVQDPLNTITASGITAGLVTSNLIKLRGTSKEGQPVSEPLHTISAGGTHHAEVRAFLLKYDGTDQDPKLGEPLHTVTTKDRFGLVTVKGQPYAIVDIGLRMLKPRELYRAQGFKDSYIIDWGIHPHTGERIKMTATASIRMCGNSVCPPMAEAYVRANYREQQPERLAA